MSLKRTPGADQRGSGDKRVRLLSPDETSISQMPVEMIHKILIKAVAMEVKTMKLAKRVWKEKADLVIRRLGSVCSHWSSILTTDFFRMELHRALDGQEEAKMRIEMLYQYPIHTGALSVCLLGRHVYVLRKDCYLGFVIDVQDRLNLALSKTILRLPGWMNPQMMVSCSQNNSLFLINKYSVGWSVLRVKLSALNSYTILIWFNPIVEPITFLSVSSSGSLLIISHDARRGSSLTNLDKNGQFQYELVFRIRGVTRVESAVQKENGHYIVTALSANGETFLAEFDENGKEIRKFALQLKIGGKACLADRFGRIVTYSGWDTNLTLLDPEMNSLEFAGQPITGVRRPDICMVCGTNELGRVVLQGGITVLVVYRFREE